MDIPKNKAIDIKEIAKMYKEQYNEELPNIVFRDPNGYPIYPITETTKAAAKPEIEIKKFKDLMFSIGSLANSEKPEPSKYGDMPKTFYDREKKDNDSNGKEADK